MILAKKISLGALNKTELEDANNTFTETIRITERI